MTWLLLGKTSSALRGLSAEDHAGASQATDERLLLIEDVALEIPQRTGALHHPRLRPQEPLPYRLEVVRLELQRGEALVLSEGGGHSVAHRRVAKVHQD